MQHQRSHCRPLSRRAGGRQRRRHTVPVVGRRTKVSTQSAVRCVRIAPLPNSRVRPVPILHHLRHRRGHASRQRPLAQTLGTQFVVRNRLVPGRGQQRSHYRVIALRAFRGTLLQPSRMRGQRSVARCRAHHAVAVSKPGGKGRRHTVHRQDTLVRIAQDGRHTVVRTHHCKTALLEGEQI